MPRAAARETAKSGRLSRQLFIPERFDRIELGSLSRGVESKKDADRGREAYCQENDAPANAHRVLCRPIHDGGEAKGQASSDEPTHDAKQDGFDEKSQLPVGSTPSDGQPDSDLAGPHRHGSQHDVHGPDAAHDERDARDGSQKCRERAEGLVGECNDLGLIPEFEIILRGERDAVMGTHDRSHLSSGLFHAIRFGGAGNHLVDAPARGKALERRCDRHKDGVVLVLASDCIPILLFQNTHDAKGKIPEFDFRNQRLPVREEFARYRFSQCGDAVSVLHLTPAEELTRGQFPTPDDCV